MIAAYLHRPIPQIYNINIQYDVGKINSSQGANNRETALAMRSNSCAHMGYQVELALTKVRPSTVLPTASPPTP